MRLVSIFGSARSSLRVQRQKPFHSILLAPRNSSSSTAHLSQDESISMAPKFELSTLKHPLLKLTSCHNTGSCLERNKAVALALLPQNTRPSSIGVCANVTPHLEVPKGTKDWHGKDVQIREKIFSTIIDVFKRHVRHRPYPEAQCQPHRQEPVLTFCEGRHFIRYTSLRIEGGMYRSRLSVRDGIEC